MERLHRHGWRLRHARDVAGSPEEFQAYVQHSRGEFSCAKPSCMAFQNAWISDRTLCYLASGRPVVVQDTGPSAYLPHGLGMFRFRSLEEAADALAAVDADYAKHCRAAREIAEACFDARAVLPRLLETALG
jgi:glycosyltransferase involved in cell wall biosynthesis